VVTAALHVGHERDTTDWKGRTHFLRERAKARPPA
jgi:hypothetical protein